jgi:Fe-S cluster biogenesis protein NfuA
MAGGRIIHGGGADPSFADLPDPIMTEFETRVRAVLESLRPMLRADGGDIELVLADEARGRVEVHLKGACSHCAASMITLSMGVEARLREALPTIREVVRV